MRTPKKNEKVIEKTSGANRQTTTNNRRNQHTRKNKVGEASMGGQGGVKRAVGTQAVVTTAGGGARQGGFAFPGSLDGKWGKSQWVHGSWGKPGWLSKENIMRTGGGWEHLGRITQKEGRAEDPED